MKSQEMGAIQTISLQSYNPVSLDEIYSLFKVVLC
jgi:hypothetical protein